ncbi:MAG: T9SS type A sorting domain-containing protein [Bacteroidales bacterium]|nr:T9SS type A sorting domain-containing protein [Bacteroidales bacterium]
MKKLLSFLAVVLISAAAFAQSVTLTFTAKDAANHYVQLNRVSITNLTKGWQETIYWPDTTLTMQNGTGINDVETFPETSLKLSQNNPNPFTGTTEVSLTVSEEDEVMLDIMDVNGKTVGTHRMRPQAGTHQFCVTLSTAGTYVMTARQNGQTSSIKMVCNGGGDGNRIEYTGVVETHGRASLPSSQPKNGPKYTTTRPFNFGDQMEYVGYATINGSEAESQRIMQAQGASQTFTLQFAETQTQVQLPTVTTSAVSNITSSSATAGGTVISDGGATVFDRGVCYSTASMPTVSENCIHIGQGTGTFSDNITGLNDNTTYYVRAYAMSSAGIAYGNEVSFTTTSTSAITVTTDPVTNIGSHTVTCGGTVIYAGEENIMVRGLCWNTSPNPTANHSHTTDGSGVGHFTSQLTSLNQGTTYYVRAYATSVFGTVYGNEVCFTTGVDGLPCPGTAAVTDIDNNTYNTVLIGNQCWMKENLRTTRYANGVNIPMGSSSTYSNTDPYRYNPDDNANNVPTYG